MPTNADKYRSIGEVGLYARPSGISVTRDEERQLKAEGAGAGCDWIRSGRICSARRKLMFRSIAQNQGRANASMSTSATGRGYLRDRNASSLRDRPKGDEHSECLGSSKALEQVRDQSGFDRLLAARMFATMVVVLTLASGVYDFYRISSQPAPPPPSALQARMDARDARWEQVLLDGSDAEIDAALGAETKKLEAQLDAGLVKWGAQPMGEE